MADTTLTPDAPQTRAGGQQPAQAPGRPPRWLFPALSLAAIVCLLGAIVALQALQGRVTPEQQAALTPDPGMDALSIPDFEMTAQDASAFTRADLQGQITVVDFFFSNCPFICPTLSRNMLQLQELLADEPGVNFLSVSVDPTHDTPDSLRAYAEEIGADPSRWKFVTSDSREPVQRILTEGLMLNPLEEDAAQPIDLGGGKSMANILHPSYFVLLGPDAEVLGLYRGTQAGQMPDLAERARLAAEGARRLGRLSE
jgi:protein SCO1/2